VIVIPALRYAQGKLREESGSMLLGTSRMANRPIPSGACPERSEGLGMTRVFSPEQTLE
jgi:hypothetical protein